MSGIKEIAFVDGVIPDLEQFLAGLRPGVEAVVLDALERAPAQMARALGACDGIEALHVVAHGRPGAVEFEAGPLSVDNLRAYSAELQTVAAALTPDARIYLWSCRTGAGEDGAAYVQALSRALHARVSAAIGSVGASSLGGRWDLEVGAPATSSQAPLSAEAIGTYAGILPVIDGGSGDDTLNDTAGDDTINGFGGDDTINVTHGTDTIDGGDGSDVSFIDYAASSTNVNGGPGGYGNNADDDVTFFGIEHIIITTGSGNDGFSTGDGNDIISSGAGNDDVRGAGGNNSIDAGAGNDLVYVNMGTETLDGGDGIDSLVAWRTLFVASTSIVIDLATDYYVTPGGSTIVNFERLYTFYTGSGDDTLVTGSAAFDDWIINTGEGDDTITVMNGHDSEIHGWMGNDRLVVNYAASTQNVNGSVTGQFQPGYGGSYSDNAGRSVGFAGIEDFTILTGSGNDSITTGDGNDILTGGAGADALNSGAGVDRLAGDAGNDTLDGGAGIDTLEGGEGNDSLIGGAGGDSMVGGEGDDVFVVTANSEATVELADEGTDTVQSANSYTLKANVESLTLTGTGDVNGTGNELANLITGNAGDNRLDGGVGIDTLEGGEGNDSLIGGAGGDSMVGGAGDDIYVVTANSEATVELTDEGTDTVQSANSYTLKANVENLTLTGTGDVNGTGNELANSIVGNDGKNTLNGLGDNDTLDGGVGIDTLEGGEGNDSLNGGAGGDSMVGGAGDDIYVVTANSEATVELTGEGTDTVQSANSYTLKANVENLTLTGTGDVNGTGNELANLITGNAGDNRLDGGVGIDTLIGGGDADLFLFSAPTHGPDVITDFVRTVDVFALENTGFGIAGTGSLGANTIAFVTGTAATAAKPTIIFDPATSHVSWDADGSGAGTAQLLATLIGITTMNGPDFTIA